MEKLKRRLPGGVSVIQVQEEQQAEIECMSVLI